MPLSPVAAPCTSPVRQVRFSDQLVAHESPVAMSVQDIANRAQPDLKLLRAVLGQLRQGAAIDAGSAHSALLGVFNRNDDHHFLAPEQAAQVEQYIIGPRRSLSGPFDRRHRFLRSVLTQASATFDRQRAAISVAEFNEALIEGRNVGSADAGDVLLAILVMNEHLDFLSGPELDEVERSLARACARRRVDEDDRLLLFEMTQRALIGRRVEHWPT
ncbi:hypothetical protein [uncultured Stenotrophomonas sp.]|uniref:hypothetical protein n=1 Tax=uncultured Stenotrophomonas sp. TaxID=165438 RepID=UPI0025D0AB65|nr:hypothetical protein [uncultured Stenotrophomonas sp.]